MNEFARTLRIVAADFQRMAAQIERLGTAECIGELEPPISTYSLDAQAAVYDLLKQDGIL